MLDNLSQDNIYLFAAILLKEMMNRLKRYDIIDLPGFCFTFHFIQNLIIDIYRIVIGFNLAGKRKGIKSLSTPHIQNRFAKWQHIADKASTLKCGSSISKLDFVAACALKIHLEFVVPIFRGQEIAYKQTTDIKWCVDHIDTLDVFIQNTIRDIYILITEHG
ncbi:hypothetical protein D3C78_830140 [compost metagenome]